MAALSAVRLHRGQPPDAKQAHRIVAWQTELAWVGGAAGLGFAVTTITSSWLRLPRGWVVLVLAIAVGAFVTGYLRRSGLDARAMLRRRWVWAATRGALLGTILVIFFLQPDPSSRDEGRRLAFDLIWLGVVYGIFDALLLNVVPMTAAWRAATSLGWTATWPGRVAGALLTLAANLLVTTAYHLGYSEFRGPAVSDPIGSNLLIGLGYVLAPNPLTSLIGHVILHVAAVLAGTEGPVQLPPHY